MRSRASSFWKVIGVAGALAALAAWPGIGQAQLGLPGIPPLPPLPGGGGSGTQTLTGQASAVTAVVFGTVTSLADSGTLVDAADPLGTGQPLGSIPGLLSAEALHAATMGWSDQVASEASLGNLSMTVAGIGITATTIISRALAVSGGAPVGLSNIEGLMIGGMSVSPTGIPNEAVSVAGLNVVLNEQVQSASGIVVNALHVTDPLGLTDVVQLAQARVTDEVIISQIRNTGSVFQLSANDTIWLKQNGVSDAVVMEMQATATRYPRRMYSATPVYVVEPAPPPVSVGVGFGYYGHGCRW